MCIVCTELAKGKLNRMEARRALSEVSMDPKQKEHVQQVMESLKKQDEQDTLSQKKANTTQKN